MLEVLIYILLLWHPWTSQRVAFRLQPTKREGPQDHLLPHLLANPPRRPSSYKNRTPLTATGIDPKFNTPIRIMSKLRQYHPSLRVFQIEQSQKGWISIGDTSKDFAILQSETKMKQVFGPKVKVSLPKSYHSADASKIKFLVFKGVSINITVDEFKELLDFIKITHAEAERIKSKITGKNLPFSGGFVCQKTGIIFRVEEFKTTASILQCYKCQGFGHKAQNCTKCQKCVVWWWSSFTQRLSK